MILSLLFTSLLYADQWVSVRDLNQSYMYGTKKDCLVAQSTKHNECIRVDNVVVVKSSGKLKIVKKK